MLIGMLCELSQLSVLRIASIPSQIMFEISLFPHNVPLPSPPTTARLIGGLMHFFHLCVRISQERRVPDSDLGWEDMFRETEERPWFDWVSTPQMALVLVVVMCLV